MSLVGGTGDIDKQVDGIHENLLMLKIREANFTKLADSLEWFTFYDTVGMLNHSVYAIIKSLFIPKISLQVVRHLILSYIIE